MTTLKHKIILFDDIAQNRAEVKTALITAFGSTADVQEFEPGVSKVMNGTYEHRIKADLMTTPNDRADLILADRDLSAYSPTYTGLSEATVRRVADDIGIPECGYARGEREGDQEYIKTGEQREECIRLPLKPLDQFALRVSGITNGFAQIRGQIEGALERIGSRPSAAKLLAIILGKPEYADKIALYASGDQNRLASVLEVRGKDDDRCQRLACLLGYWLWDSVLRFPGVTVGEIPASSYLNIRKDVFRDDSELQALFSSALYAGPFSQAKIKMWWRGMLDDLVAESGAADGRELAARLLRREIPRSECCEDANRPAGYYCMLREEPVSFENSKPGLSWFPRGADLARISASKLDELGPWL